MRLAEVFPARMEALARVNRLAEEAGAAAGFERHDSLRLALVIEELFTNTVTHGYGGDSEAPVRIAFDVEPERVAVTYEDTGPPFDPFASVGEAADPSTTDDFVPGGLGLVLITHLAGDVDYTRAEGWNCISLVMEATR